MNEVDVAKDRSHVPAAGADPTWQESWYVGFFDQFCRAVGFGHVGIAWVAGRADVWHWVALDGRVISRFQRLDAPVPERDLSDFEMPTVDAVSRLADFGVDQPDVDDLVAADVISSPDESRSS